MKKFLPLASIAMTAAALSGCYIFSFKLPDRAKSGAHVKLTSELGPSSDSSNGPVGICVNLPSDWVLGDASCTLSTVASCTLTPDTSTPAGLTPVDGNTWTCWQDSTDTIANGATGTFGLDVSVGAAGTYVTALQLRYVSPVIGPRTTNASRSITIDGIAPADANIEIFGAQSQTAKNGSLLADDTQFYALNGEDFIGLGDGTTYTPISTIPVPSNDSTIYTVVSGNGIFVALGFDNDAGDNGAGFAYSSGDGITWTLSEQAFPNIENAVFAKAGKRFVVVGEAQAIYSSVDGLTWTTIPTDPAGPTEFQWIASSATQLVVLGIDLNGSTAYVVSGDSVTPVVVVVDGAAAGAFNSVGYANDVGFAFGTDTDLVLTTDLSTGTLRPTGTGQTPYAYSIGPFVYTGAGSGGGMYRVTADGLSLVLSPNSGGVATVAANDRRTLWALDGYKQVIGQTENPRLAATVSGNVISVRNSGTGTLQLAAPVVSTGLTVTGCNQGAVSGGTSCRYIVSGSGTGTVQVVSNGVIDPAKVTLNVDLSVPATGDDGGSEETPSTNPGNSNSDDGCAATPVSLYAALAAAVLIARGANSRRASQRSVREVVIG